ncbi:hypothetical protein ACIBI8_23175 [Streptomyces sp. NPDC050529]|uniref:hypothetical protein n=1 Tax=unclassified Streptomyces TaxID=2593676 RepID=UPI002DD85777|nr:hypothetical protein [Streptomyces sp. NBC_01022]WRZ79554.1 hypothetical protein OG316_04395 [Streptomyces sp. NBC_01022]
MATNLGHCRNPAARENAAGLLSAPVLAHAALFAELARPVAGVDELESAVRLARPDPAATAQLADFLVRVPAAPKQAGHERGPGARRRGTECRWTERDV